MREKACLYMVVPCYNEQEVLPETAKRLIKKLDELISADVITENSKILFVNDGSKDFTWAVLTSLYNKSEYVCALGLSNNRGHQNALLAGMEKACEYADIIISMDADLQDDIDAIDEFVKEYYNGSDIVYGVRSSRGNDSFFKKNTALCFYRFMSFLGADIVHNHADYRLMSKRAVEALAQFSEVNLFLRGIVPLIGFKTSKIKYERGERFAGETKYPLGKMIALALNGITSFSIKPIRFITLLGGIVFSVSLMLMIYFLTVYLMGQTVEGWSTLAISIWGLGGIQLLSLGIIGEYIGKIYLETKARPKYIIQDFLKH